MDQTGVWQGTGLADNTIYPTTLGSRDHSGGDQRRPSQKPIRMRIAVKISGSAGWQDDDARSTGQRLGQRNRRVDLFQRKKIFTPEPRAQKTMAQRHRTERLSTNLRGLFPDDQNQDESSRAIGQRRERAIEFNRRVKGNPRQLGRAHAHGQSRADGDARQARMKHQDARCRRCPWSKTWPVKSCVPGSIETSARRSSARHKKAVWTQPNE